MSGLYGSISIALSALRAEQGAMEVTANNVANINTPGFSRQRPVILPGEPVVIGALSFGTGVSLEKLESLRDPILELRLHEETQQQGYVSTLVNSMSQMEILFNSTGAGIGDSLTKFFNSLSQLSTDPSSTALRQTLLTAAGNLANAFHEAATNLQTQRSNLDLDVQQTVDDINVLTEQIAKINLQVATLQNLHEDASAFIDQQTQSIRKLSSLIDVSVIRTETGLSLTTSKGIPLVTLGQSFPLGNMLSSDGTHHILAEGVDVTSQIGAGKLGGLLLVRDQKIPDLSASLDELAFGLVQAINDAHRQGFDANGVQGGDLFIPIGSSSGAATNMEVAIQDADLLAASSDGSPGSNGNIERLLAVHDLPIASSQTPVDFFSRLTFEVGNDIANGKAELEASDLVLRELEDQRGGISGVSLDEEAANLIRYQQAYQAAARIVTTVNEMLDTIINLGR